MTMYETSQMLRWYEKKGRAIGVAPSIPEIKAAYLHATANKRNDRSLTCCQRRSC